MLCITAAVFAALLQMAVEAFGTTSLKNLTSQTVLENHYMITFDSGSSANRTSSVHTRFYYDLESRGINCTIVREYHDPLFIGTVLRLFGANDFARLTEMRGAERVSPVHIHHIPPLVVSTRLGASKRARRGGVPWSHIVTGIDKVHATGYDGQGITIGIVDSGVDYSHPALGGGFGPGYKIVGGYDFVGDAFTGESESIPQPSAYPLDTCHDHGTHVAGIIGANPSPEREIIGVAYRASINAYRIFGCNGANRADIVIDGLLRAHRDGNDIINLSLAFPHTWGTTAFATIIDGMASLGRIVIVSSGNYGEKGAWMADFIKHHQRIIGVGHVARIGWYPSIPGSARVVMSSGSSYGPTSDMHLGTALGAPGEDILSTWPVRLGSYATRSGASQATAFVTGSVALWLQINGKDTQSTMAARAAFQNTARPVQYASKAVIDTVAHQGAGLVQVHKAAFSKGSMLPAELLLNDTTYSRLLWTVHIRNSGNEPVTYKLAHVPAGTINTMSNTWRLPGPRTPHQRSAAATLSPERFTVSANSMQEVTVSLLPPSRVDPSKFPVYSGYIKATGSDGSVLQSLYLGLAAPMNQMRVLDASRTYIIPRITRRPNKHRIAYTMHGTDTPVLAMRLVTSTPLLRLELVDPGASVLPSPKTSCRSRMGTCIGRFANRYPVSTGLTPIACINDLRIVGVIEERRNAGHDHQTWRSSGTEKVSVVQFADGSVIHDGRYRLLLRVLKKYGRPDNDEDYEAWLSPEIRIERA